MSMNGNDLGDALVAALIGIDGSMTPAQIAHLRSSWRALSAAWITYVKANMDVLPAGLSGPGLQNPVGQIVLIPSTSGPGSPSNGSTSAVSTISGTGSVQ